MKEGQEENDKLYRDIQAQAKDNKEDIYKIDDDMEKQKQKKMQQENGYKFGKFLNNDSVGYDQQNFQVQKDNIKFTMLNDAANDRYIIVENTYEYQKYFILEYDETRSQIGIGNHLQVTQYVKVNVNIQTGITGRGERGIDIDTKEFIALKNIIHFNCQNPFG